MIGWSFAIPTWWPALLVLPLLAWVGVLRQLHRARRVREALGEREPRLAGRAATVLWRRACGLLALLCLGIAWLQPIDGTDGGEARGPDLVIVLDVSWSMAAQDVQPSRMARAVAEIEALAARARGARAGLVAFAGEARLLVPLTHDVAAIAAVAGRLVPGAELRGGTDLGAAIVEATAALDRAGSAAGNIIVLTDGEDFGGAGLAAAERARERDTIVHCIGLGTAVGSKIAVEDEGGQTFLRDASGAEVVSSLDPEGLTALAGGGGGDYASGLDVGVLSAAYDRYLVPRARAVRIDDGRTALGHRFQWPLLAAWVLWMLRRVMPERRR